MTTWDDQDHILTARRNGCELKRRRGLGAERQVELLFQQSLQKLLGNPCMESEAEIPTGIFPQVAGDQSRDKIYAQHPEQSQADQALAPGHSLQSAHSFIQGCQCLLCTKKELLPKPGQCGSPPGPFKQRHTQLCLQLGNGMAQAGLCDAELLCRAGEMTGMRQLDEVAEVQQIHERSPL